uniref:Uncharacterized protein n=1 Tax=Ignisphaera aggregans TaxID=334771 RepID=A0A7C5Z651_9CREN
MKPYIVRFVSLEAGKGKTYIASSVLAKLKLKGYITAAIKHAAHDIDIKGKIVINTLKLELILP